MMDEGNYYTYIMTNHSGTLYTGVTSNLVQRVFQHKQGMVEGFTKRYRINRLVYFEATPSKRSAIERERQIKSWRREKKVKLIESMNPNWKDLSEGWYEGSFGGDEEQRYQIQNKRDPSTGLGMTLRGRVHNGRKLKK